MVIKTLVDSPFICATIALHSRTCPPSPKAFILTVLIFGYRRKLTRLNVKLTSIMLVSCRRCSCRAIYPDWIIYQSSRPHIEVRCMSQRVHVARPLSLLLDETKLDLRKVAINFALSKGKWWPTVSNIYMKICIHESLSFTPGTSHLMQLARQKRFTLMCAKSYSLLKWLHPPMLPPQDWFLFFRNFTCSLWGIFWIAW